MGALFLITNKKSSNLLQNADFIRDQEPNSEISSSFISKNLPELKQEIYERAQSSKDVKAEFTKRGKISNLSDLVKHQDKDIRSAYWNPHIDMKFVFSVLPESSSFTMKDGIIENEEIVVSSKDEKLNILFWNGFWNWPFFGMGVGNRGFVSNKCKYQNCYTTNQRKKIRNNHTRIDAVVVHGIDEDLAKLANKNVGVDTFWIVILYERFEQRKIENIGNSQFN